MCMNTQPYTHTADRIQTGQYPQTTDRKTGTDVENSDFGLLFVKLIQWEVSVFMAQCNVNAFSCPL